MKITEEIITKKIAENIWQMDTVRIFEKDDGESNRKNIRSTKIEETEVGTWLVNGIEVYFNSENKYISKSEITAYAKFDFMEYLKKKKLKKMHSDVECPKELQLILNKLHKLKYQLEILETKSNPFSEGFYSLQKYYYTEIEKNEIRSQNIINQNSVKLKNENN